MEKTVEAGSCIPRNLINGHCRNNTTASVAAHQIVETTSTVMQLSKLQYMMCNRHLAQPTINISWLYN